MNKQEIIEKSFFYKNNNKNDLALNGFLKLLEIDPGNECGHHEIILIYIKQKKYKLAKEGSYKLLELNPNSLAAYQELGCIYLEEGDYQQSTECFYKVIDLYPEEKDAQIDSEIYRVASYINLGRAYYLSKEYELSIENFKKAMELDPNDKKIRKLLSQAYLAMKKYDLAVDVLDEDYELTNVALRKIPYKIKIIRIPNFYGSDINSSEMNSIMIPPLALGNLVSYIRSQGIPIDQDDLHIKIHHDNYFGDIKGRIDESVFFDVLRVIKYTKGNSDPEIERIMDKVSQKTDLLGYKILLFSIDFVSMNHSHAMFALCLARYLKRRNDPIIILGGMKDFIEVVQKDGCEWSDIDYIICNDGEEILVDLLLSLLNNSPLKKGRIEENGRVIYAIEVSKPVRPDFDGLPLDRYKYRGLKIDYYRDESSKDIVEKFNQSRTFLLPFKFIKGCTNKCIFCESSFGGLEHVVPPYVVVDWLQQLQTRYNPTGYLFLSDTLNISSKYINQLCDEIIKRKLKILWSDCARVDRLDKESIYKMREAGCIRLVYGMETASKRLLSYVNKDIDLKQLEEALYWTDRAGIWTGIEVISGLPFEKEEDVDETISFIKRNREYIDAIYAGCFYLKEVSLMGFYAEKYGITNIFKLLSYKDGFGTFVKYGFDEINGLKWPEKRKQILSSHTKVMEALNGNSRPFPEHEYESFLFFLYSSYTDKRTIRDIFYSVGKEKNKYINTQIRPNIVMKSKEVSSSQTLAYG